MLNAGEWRPCRTRCEVAAVDRHHCRCVLGVKTNVVPGEASAIINHRVHPADDIDSVVQHLKKVINDDRDVRVPQTLGRAQSIRQRLMNSDLAE